ncbi:MULTISPECIES: transketolase [Eubacterium]|uniref:Transketolase n=2 Tax=Eubacterium TaxID=1730 RepID=A0A1H3DRI2_EUBBA|nr:MULTISPECIES: transketolase [Eubacterium]MDD4692670.1 transketolase [Eubacterium aggregans]SDX69132.1 transketolase [Eubacterium barkeri]
MGKLEATAKDIRKDIVKMIGKAASGHPGGSLSAVEILALLYFEKMNVDPKDPKKEDRDRFVLSKGHAAPVLYATLAAKGFFPKEELDNLRQIGHMLQGHPDMKKIPGVDMSTGSLGQGIGAAVGMALGAKLDKADWKTYVLLGDGELQEGMVWEAAMSAAHYKLDNLIAFVDNNNLQIDGAITDVMSPYPIDEKFAAFGWNVIVVEDGNNFDQLRAALEQAGTVAGKPTVLVCKTVKGKGVSYMENNAGWHGKGPNADEVAQALSELDA